MRRTLSTFDEVWQCQFRKRLLNVLDQFDQTSKFVLGCSGGMDSMLLLHLFIELVPTRLHVISVDHQLQAKSAAWSAFVADTCEQYNITCEIVAVDVEQGNLEAQARAARYQAFSERLNAHDVLLLAHHQQDQAETVLLRLLQGTGVRGLAAMQELETRDLINQHDADDAHNLNDAYHNDAYHSDKPLSYFLWRPLLPLSKQQIEIWVQQLGLEYVNDPMNADAQYDRVWCREALWPLLQQRFPKMQDSITRCAELMQDADEILTEVSQQDYADCVDAEQRLNIVKLQQRSSARQRQVLSVWMQAGQQYRPPLAMIERLKREVLNARQDATSQLHYAGYYFVRFEHYAYRYRQAEWQAFQQLPIPQQISFVQAGSYQLALGQVKILSDMPMGLSDELLNCDLSLLPRQGGEKIQLYGRVGHRLLKKTLQDAKIAPWFRHQIQILMYHNTPLGVFTPQGFWLAQSPFCKMGGWLPQLQTNID